jgi:hypothetical protein
MGINLVARLRLGGARRAVQRLYPHPLHERQAVGRYRTWQIIDAAAADAHSLRLLADRQIVVTVDHRFALSNPALVSAPSKKSFSSVAACALDRAAPAAGPSYALRGMLRQLRDGSLSPLEAVFVNARLEPR